MGRVPLACFGSSLRICVNEGEFTTSWRVWRNKPKQKHTTFSQGRPSRSEDGHDERDAVEAGQFGTTSAPRWPHFAHTKPLPSDLMGVSSGKWPTLMIVLCLQRPELQ